MRRAFFLLVALLILGGSASPQLLADDDRTPGAGHFGRSPRDLIDVPGLPRPVEPSPQIAEAEPQTFQLVGFTAKLYGGDEGILNFALACRAQFGGGRMCTAEEINRTLHVPDAPGTGYAWIQRTGSGNCRGWMSESNSDLGVAIDLGRCYGGQIDRTCDSLLRVACCAPIR